MSKAIVVAILLIFAAQALKIHKPNTLIQVEHATSANSDAPDFVTLETGSLIAMAEDANDWHHVDLSNRYDKPVVMMQITTFNGGHPVHPRIKNINTDSFEFKLEEWEYLDEWHTEELIHYIVAEEGKYELACGQNMIVGTVSDMHETWTEIDFEEHFSSTPTILSQCQTENGPDAVVTRHKDISKDSFNVKLQEQEAFGEHPVAEIVGYFAVEQGACGNVVANNGENIYTHEWEAISFEGFGADLFDEAPFAFAQMQTTNGGNTANLRMQALSETGFEVFVEEEQSGDDETAHVEEVVGFFVLEVPHTVNLEIEDHCDDDSDATLFLQME